MTRGADARPAPGQAAQHIGRVLRRYLSEPITQSVLLCAASRAGVRMGGLRAEDVTPFAREVARGVRLFIDSAAQADECILALAPLLEEPARAAPAAPEPASRPRPAGEHSVSVVAIRREHDIVEARTSARDLCEQLGFARSEQTKIATLVSELARNIVLYAGTGTVTLRTLRSPRTGIEVEANDEGPGIANVEEIFDGSFRSKRGMGMGLRSTKRLAHAFELRTAPGAGTTVTLRMFVGSGPA